MPEEDDDQGECEKCLVVLDFDVASGVHATEVVQPGVASLDDPAVTCETIARPLDHSICPLPTDFRGARQDRLTSRSTPADDRLDTPLEQTLTLRRSVVPTISPELTRPETRRDQLIDQRKQETTLVRAPARDTNRQRNTPPLNR